MKPYLIKKETKMPNVDSCVREAEAGLCKDCRKHAVRIAAISDNLRVRVFRSKSEQEIEDILKRCSETVKACIIDKFYNGRISIDEIVLEPSSDDNKEGADLVHVLPNGEEVSIEVKFGAQTDRNIGMKTFIKIFGSKVFKEALSNKNRKSWLALFDRDNSEENQFKRLHDTLNLAVDKFNEEQRNKNFKLTHAEQAYMEEEIINASGGANVSKTYDHYLKFVLDGEDFSSFSRLTTGVGSWIVQSVNKLSDEVKRVNIFVNNYDTNMQIKYVLNWKNNYPHNGESLMAKLGFGCPSWNVWITVEITTLE